MSKTTPEHIRARWRAASKRYNAKNREKETARKKLWRESNRGKVRATQANRVASLKRAAPTWLGNGELRMIRAIYEMAERLTRCTGIPHQVDHIVPILGKNVCGLHVPWNLAVIPADVNRRKGNRFPSDQVHYQMG